MVGIDSHSRTPTLLRRRRISLSTFFVIAFALSWLGAIPMIIASWRPGTLPPGLTWLQLLMFFGPALSALLVAWWNEGKAGVMNLLQRLLIWRVGLRWYGVAMLAPALLMGSAWGISRLLGSPGLSLATPLTLLTNFVTILLGYLLLNSEEIAWRGYALPALLVHFTPWRASLILGLLMGGFHLPLFLLKGGHPAGYPLGWFLLMILTLTVGFTWLLLRTQGSLLLVHLFHQALNAWAEVIPFFPSRTGSLTPLIVMVVLLLLSAFLIRWQWYGQES